MVPARRQRRFHRAVDGILLLDKPVGLTSNEALQRARRLYGALKAGHGGSLDPLASGLLPVCFGQATKVCGALLDATKTYRVTIQLGARTASGDLEADIIERQPVPPLTESQIQDVLTTFLGVTMQIPPMYSAVRIEGRRLYELARQGRSVERSPRPINISSIQLLRWESPELDIEVSCSKGTYIRVLAEDVATRLGTVAYVKALRRTAVLPFDAQHLRSLDELEQAAPEVRDGWLLPVDTTFAAYPQVWLSPEQLDRFIRGQSVPNAGHPAAKHIRVYGPEGTFIGLGVGTEGRLQPSRLFVEVEALIKKQLPADSAQSS
jgi:tRNA pseudouridine55 synthase